VAPPPPRLQRRRQDGRRKMTGQSRASEEACNPGGRRWRGRMGSDGGSGGPCEQRFRVVTS
jgi:hypothetical protein